MISDYHSIENMVTKNTLLIVLDTHRPSMLEYPALLYEVGNTVVIDHHRKAVDHIANAVIFYHETSASSASEMVCELLHYISEGVVGLLRQNQCLRELCLIQEIIVCIQASEHLRRRRFFAEGVQTQ